jgi:hypothetical protein
LSNYLVRNLSWDTLNENLAYFFEAPTSENNEELHQFLPYITVKLVVLLLHIQEIPGSNLSSDINCPDFNFHGFPVCSAKCQDSTSA